MEQPSRRWLVGGGIYVSLAALLATISISVNALWAWLCLIAMLLPFGWFLIYPIYLLTAALSPDLEGNLLSAAVGVLCFASAAAINVFLIWSITTGLRRRWASRR